MKESDIIKKLRSEADEFTPDPLAEIKLKAGLEGERAKAKPDRSTVRRGERKRLFRRGVFAGIAAAAACIVAVVAIVFSGNVPSPSPSRHSTKLTASAAYGVGAVSAVKLLGGGVSASAVSALASVGGEIFAEKTDAGGDDERAAIEKFDGYFRALDGFWGKDVATTAVTENSDSGYRYAKKMIIESVGVGGGKTEYVMYYDETERIAETDDDEEEREYVLSGVIIIGGKEYAVEGERSEETEEGEREDELKIRAYADVADRTTYVEMEQEKSVEQGETETEYVYSVYRGGRLIERTAVEFESETERGKTETVYELEFLDGTGKGKYTVERVSENGGTIIKVEYAAFGKRGSFTVSVASDASGKEIYGYVFPDGTRYSF